ncbi:MAG: glycosyltransferase, partial [Microcystaceae cyanobacterium]
SYPTVCAIIPARNEAETLPQSLPSLLDQDYPGQFSIILIDDQSSDRTGEIAQTLAEKKDKKEQLTVITGQPLPSGWSGKLWAMEQGIQSSYQQEKLPDYFLFTDADIQHHPQNLRELVTKAEQEHLALTSLMVLLRCQSFWEKLLIPAFVFFFQKLYPFPWVNNPQRTRAAAAGGCILVKREALEKIGGIQSLREALIDDCTLAQKVKALKLGTEPTAIWLGLTRQTISLRPYESLDSIWTMVARTAYSQLNFNPFLLVGTLLGMTLVYLMAPLGLIAGLIFGNLPLILLALLTWLTMAIAYYPTLKLYQLSFFWALSLPLIASLYNLMTWDSAVRYWQGQGGAWKGRTYTN